MTRFTDLSNELIIAIGSHIRKPPHSLHLILLNRQTHSLIMPLLYEHIVLDLNDYLVQEYSQDEFEVEPRTMARLSATLAANSDLRSVIRTLEISPNSIGRHYELRDLLSLTTSLKRFRLLGRPRLDQRPIVGSALASVSAALESLDLSSSDYCYQSPFILFSGAIASLDHFIVLKHLSIRSSFCIGTMEGLLPECLQQLDVHCHDDSPEGSVIKQGDRIARLLVDLMEEGLRTPQSLRSVTLWLYWKGRVEPSVEEQVQEMVDKLDISTVKFYQNGVEMDAKVRLVRLDL